MLLCCWLVSISSSSMFPSSPNTSALAGAGRAARTLDAALCNCPRRSHIHPQGLCHPSWCLCWSSLSSVKHACITVLLISSAAAAVLLSSALMFPVRAGPGMSGVGSAAPGQDAVVCNCHCVPVITTITESGQAAAGHGEQWNIAHIVLPLFYRRDMKIIKQQQQHFNNKTKNANTHAHLQLSTLYMSVTKE